MIVRLEDFSYSKVNSKLRTMLAVVILDEVTLEELHRDFVHVVQHIDVPNVEEDLKGKLRAKIQDIINTYLSIVSLTNQPSENRLKFLETLQMDLQHEVER